MIDVLFRAKCKQGNFQLQQQSSAHMHRKSISAAQRKNCEVHKIFDCSSVVRCMPLHFCISSFGFVCLYLRMRGVPLRIGTQSIFALVLFDFFFFCNFFQHCLRNCACVRDKFGSKPNNLNSKGTWRSANMRM